jgi:hypothetical protein
MEYPVFEILLILAVLSVVYGIQKLYELILEWKLEWEELNMPDDDLKL